MTDSKPMRAELVDDYRIKCALLLEEVIDAEEAAKLAAAEIAELRAERDRLKDALQTCIDALISANTERDRLAGELEFVKGQLAGTNRNIAGWLKSRDDNLKRAEAAEAERDRLRAALQQIASQKLFAELEAGTEDDDVDYDLIGAWDIVIGVARKALGDAS